MRSRMRGIEEFRLYSRCDLDRRRLLLCAQQSGADCYPAGTGFLDFTRFFGLNVRMREQKLSLRHTKRLVGGWMSWGKERRTTLCASRACFGESDFSKSAWHQRGPLVAGRKVSARGSRLCSVLGKRQLLRKWS